MDNNLNQELEEAKTEQSKNAVKEDAKGLWASLKIFIVELLDFRHDTDRDATVAAIKADIPFKGATAWILICSIFVASIGLNANSTAVVIGAMLISPLMGPILGIGLSIAINDIDTLRKSLVNLATMLVLSLLTAFLFFYLFPLSQDNSELLGRVKPDIRDVLIAFFGGLALIIARTKKGTVASVIFGVAIATALMPPLCTAGYGLSQGNFDYFFGAMYLFTINTIFIALATFIVLKILRFPMLKYANSQRRKNIARIVTILAVTAMLPAGWTFYDVLQETRYELDYRSYLESEINQNDNLWLQREKIDTDARKITLNFNGEITEATKSDLINELKGYEYLQDFSLVINGNKNRSADKILELYDIAINKIEKRDSIIAAREFDIDSLKLALSSHKNEMDTDLFLNLSKDAKIQFSDLESFGYAKMLASSNFRYADTITLVKTQWNSNLSDSLVVLRKQDLKTWIEQELNIENVEIISN
ncbi:MAG: DUF389 domain-containing protein [Flavobacteriaceae bacterium]|jgi:uncharacterized hydrophobic protein (TIGR00271 family)|nr:DUF389 domain-containing protein [Flavobacteriaceae bacterium]MDA7728492.1 DUF389 domain-containing protein [Flavobacteriaceae bacterium]MDA7849159.1 DUF389 domain-containing protein [Flavobacteriaceae bacterium]MDG1309552.1 DUF389 domain-containing protein [Flavobacteriaceae bacterium]